MSSRSSAELGKHVCTILIKPWFYSPKKLRVTQIWITEMATPLEVLNTVIRVCVQYFDTVISKM